MEKFTRRLVTCRSSGDTDGEASGTPVLPPRLDRRGDGVSPLSVIAATSSSTPAPLGTRQDNLTWQSHLCPAPPRYHSWAEPSASPCLDTRPTSLDTWNLLPHLTSKPCRHWFAYQLSLFYACSPLTAPFLSHDCSPCCAHCVGTGTGRFPFLPHHCPEDACPMVRGSSCSTACQLPGQGHLPALLRHVSLFS